MNSPSRRLVERGASAVTGATMLALLAVGVLAAGPGESDWAASSRTAATPPEGIRQDDSPLEVRSDGNVDDSLYPFVSAQDWVTYADHVVIATVAEEQPRDVQPGKRGATSQGRDVLLRIDRTIWSARDSAVPAPERLTWYEWGWRTEGGNSDRRVRIAIEHRSRLETGHTYLLPLRYIPASCGEGDGRIEARWVPLAGESIYPYDVGVIGSGEVSGRYERAEDNAGRTDFQWLHSGLRRDLNGRSAADLAALLNATSPGREEAYDPMAMQCPDEKG